MTKTGGGRQTRTKKVNARYRDKYQKAAATLLVLPREAARRGRLLSFFLVHRTLLVVLPMANSATLGAGNGCLTLCHPCLW